MRRAKPRTTKTAKGRLLPAFVILRGRRVSRVLEGDNVLTEAANAARTLRYGKVYLVGGSVRDVVAGRSLANDYDFAVENNAEGFARKLASKLGASYFVLDDDAGSFRMVKNRGDACFVVDVAPLRGDILLDLSKRDFTVNAIAIDVSAFGTGPGATSLIDPFNGARDLKKGVLRHVSKGIFDDDPLRLLRAYRVAQKYGLKICSATRALIRKKSGLAGLPSPERIRDELIAVFSIPGAAVSLKDMMRDGIFFSVFTELRSWKGLKGYDIAGHSFKVIDNADKFLNSSVLHVEYPWLKEFFRKPVAAGLDYGAALRLSAFLHDAGKPSTMLKKDGRLRFTGHDVESERMVGSLLRRLRFSRRGARLIARVSGNHHRVFVLASLKKRGGRNFAHFFNAVEARSCEGVGVVLLCLALCDAVATRRRASRALYKTVREALDFHKGRKMLLRARPLLTGSDIMRELLLPEGPLVGAMMRELAVLVEAGEVASAEEAVVALRRLLSSASKK